MTLKLNDLNREQVRLDSIEKELKLAQEYRNLAKSYSEQGKLRLSKQMSRNADRCQRYADFLSKADKI